MFLTDIKKELYKQNPKAEYGYTRENCAYYSTEIVVDGEEKEINFIVPFSDMGENVFDNILDAKYLIRWIAL